jgi:hypothetical protein
MKNLCFKIADFLIEVKGMGEMYLPFNLFQVKNNLKNPDIKINLEKDSFPDWEKKKLIFKTKGFWELYQVQKRMIIRDRFNGAKLNNGSRLAIFNNGLSSGKIYLTGDNTRHLEHPLSYPVGSLLMMNKISHGEGIFLHASAVKDKAGNGYIFCGCSGAGKTTMAKIWQRSNRGVVLNDDRIIIRKMRYKYYAYGCPWYATNGNLVSNEKVVIKKVFFLKHSNKNYIKKLFPQEIFSKLLTNSFFPVWDKSAIEFSFHFLNDLCRKVACFELGFRPTREIIDFVKKV